MMIHSSYSKLRLWGRNLVAWRLRHVTERTMLFIMAIITGVAAGSGAWLLKSVVAAISSWLTHNFRDHHVNWWLLAIPLAGILLTYIFTRYILRTPVEHGDAIMISDLHKGEYKLKKRYMFGSLIASSLTLGFGGSAGGEGPIAFTGAAIGSNLARVLRVTPHSMKIMIGIGSAAGIAGIFKAPIGGALFCIEVVGMSMTTFEIIPLFLACVISAMTCHVLSGFSLDMEFLNLATLDSRLLPLMIILGIICGLYSIYYAGMCHTTDTTLKHISNPWLRCLASGSTLGILIFLFPMLYGEGYAAMARLLAGDSHTIVADSIFSLPGTSPFTPLLVAAGILLTKSFAKSSTTSGGGVAGDFAPTLFAGCLLGYLFAGAANLLLGTELPVAIFAFVGMAGVMAGAIKAPLMAMFIVSEMSAAYILFLPITIVALTSFCVVKLLDNIRSDRMAPSSRTLVMNLKK